MYKFSLLNRCSSLTLGRPSWNGSTAQINGQLSSLNGPTRQNSELAEILKLDKTNK